MLVKKEIKINQTDMHTQTVKQRNAGEGKQWIN